MNEQNDVNQDSSPEQVVEVTPADSEVVNTPASEPEHNTEEKVVPYSRFQEVVKENARLKKQPEKDSTVDALSLIKLGKKLQDYGDDEIDFATEYAKSKNPEEILKALDNEMVQLAIQAKRQKVEKERLSLKPTGVQSESDTPRSFTDRLKGASMADKEKLLAEAGLYKSPRPKTDRVNLGRGK